MRQKNETTAKANTDDPIENRRVFIFVALLVETSRPLLNRYETGFFSCFRISGMIAIGIALGGSVIVIQSVGMTVG
jgi:hypothetical protein